MFAKTLTWMGPLALPLVGESCSHPLPCRYWIEEEKLADPPVLVRVAFCGAGSGPPCAWLNVRVVGDTVTFTLEVIVNVTGITNWKPGMVDEEIVILPVYVPGVVSTLGVITTVRL